MTNTNSSTRWLRFGYRSGQRGFLPALGVLSAAASMIAGQVPSHAKSRVVAMAAPTPVPFSQTMLQPMRDRRVLMMLPVRAGEGWKSTPEFTTALLRQSNTAMRKALEGTGRYSLLEVKRFNPVLMRAVQDGVATSDDLDNLLSQPTTPNASIFLSKIAFTKAPMQAYVMPALISSFVLDNLTTSDNSLSVKLTGRLYSADGQTVLRSLSATTTVPFMAAGGNMSDAAATSVSASLSRITSEFIRVPTESAVVMGTDTVPLATMAATPPAPVPTTTQTGIVLPGRPMRDASTRLPGSAPANAVDAGSAPSMPMPMPTGISTVVEIPAAEVFPASGASSDGSIPLDGTDMTTSTGDDTSTFPATDASAFPASGGTTSTSDTTADTTSDTTMDTTNASSTGSADGITDGTSTDANGTTDTSQDSVGNTMSSTPTDDTAATGTTSDGTSSEGTVGLSSTESHANRLPVPSDDSDLGFEYY